VSASWFPTPPPRPPKPISAAKVILGTVVPCAAIAVAAVLIITQRPAATTARSLAAFNACLRAKIEASPGQAPGPAALHQEAEACANHLPAGTRVPDFTRSQRPSGSQQQAYDQCMQGALANGRQGPGRGGFSRQAFENASVICRALIVGAGSPASTTPATSATGAPTA
jgi:hypothetical protein